MFKIAVLISGGGSNLQSLIDAAAAGRLEDSEICIVISDRPAAGLDRAADAGIKTELADRKTLKGELSGRIMEMIPDDTDLIVLAGYLSILSSGFVEKWKGKIINIHPALLPEFGGRGMYGMNVHRAVLEAGREKSGCTVHYVEAGVDTGETILQREVPVMPGDSPEILQKRVLAEEHIALPEAVRKIIENRKGMGK